MSALVFIPAVAAYLSFSNFAQGMFKQAAEKKNIALTTSARDVFLAFIKAMRKSREVFFYSFVYVFYGLGVGCFVEKVLMSKLIQPMTKRVENVRGRAFLEIFIQTSATAFFAELLKIVMNNKGSPGSISLGAAMFVMQTSFTKNVKLLNLC